MYISKPWATNNKDGESLKPNGTNALAIPNLNAVVPVLKGLEPAIPASASGVWKIIKIKPSNLGPGG